MKFRKRTAILLLIAFGIFLYFQITRYDFILGDDQEQILTNTQVHSIKNIPRFFVEGTYYNPEANQSYGVFYRPMMMVAYSVLYSLFGSKAGMFHLFQLLLHIANTLIVFFLFTTFFPELLSFLIACIFLVHPMNTEAVVHAADLQDLLFFFFGGLALLTVMKAEKRTPKSLVFFSFYFLLSLFSKETGFLFGLMSIVYAYLFSKKNIKQIAICVAGIALFYGIVRNGIAHIGVGESALSPIAQSSFLIRMLTVPSIIAKYLIEFIYPIHVQTSQIWTVERVDLSGFFLPLFFVFACIALSIFAGRKIIVNDKKIFPSFLFFTIWFVSGIAIHLQVIPLDATIADRWFYFPIVGLLGMIASVYYALFSEYTILRKAGVTVCIIIIIVFSARTYLRILDWSDSLTLFTRDLQTSGGNYLIENNIGNLYMDNYEYEKAKPYIVDSVKRYPYITNLNNLAIIYTHENNLQKANEYFLLALRHNSMYVVYKNYAHFLLFYANNYRESARIADTGIQRYPDGSDLYIIKALAEHDLGNDRQALKDAQYANKLFSSSWSREVLSIIKGKRNKEENGDYK